MAVTPRAEMEADVQLKAIHHPYERLYGATRLPVDGAGLGVPDHVFFGTFHLSITLFVQLDIIFE